MTTEKEGKQEKFERLAGKRVTEAIKSLRQIGNLANKSSYLYTEDHVAQIFEAIENEMNQIKGLFSQQNSPETPEFSFVKKPL